MSRTRWQEPNLARAPFVNERPVRRLALTLWLLFAVVGGLAAWQSVASRQETGARLAELVRLNAEATAARERAVVLERELRGADLPAQNERTSFLNRRLAERSFSWSRLLESVSAVMPRGVRLIRLSPDGFASEKRRSGTPTQIAATTRVQVRVSGEAEETEALLEFVDRLFQHPAFDQPNLSRESERKDSRIQFELAVAYLPEVAGGPGAAVTGKAVATATPGAPPSTGPRADTATGPSSGQALPASADAGQASGGKAAVGAPPSAAKVGAPPAERLGAGARGRTPASAWEGGAEPVYGDRSPEEKAAEDRAGQTAGAADRRGGRPAGALPVTGGAAGSGPGFPANVMPTPLRPYASTTGGRP